MGVKYMRKFAIGAIALFVVLAMALSATAASPVHKATGGGWFIVLDEEDEEQKTTVSFTAQIDAEGNVKGQMQVQARAGAGTFHADVIDLQVDGNVAWMLVKVTKASNPDILGAELLVMVIDNGEGKDAVDMFVDDKGYEYPFNGNIQVS